LTAGHLGREVGGLAACAEALGIEFPEQEQHTALGDARVALAIYDKILRGES
jgi:DNA polymerase III epsilon subunit-like protein